jgi:hypothetical protein
MRKSINLLIKKYASPVKESSVNNPTDGAINNLRLIWVKTLTGAKSKEFLAAIQGSFSIRSENQ